MPRCLLPDSQFLTSQAIRKWNKGLTESHNDLLALASFTAAAEKANQIMAAGSIVTNPLSRLCDTYCQEKMLSPMCLPRWPQAGRKCQGFSPTLWPPCTGGLAQAELLSTRKQSDLLALRFDIQSNSQDLKCWICFKILFVQLLSMFYLKWKTRHLKDLKRYDALQNVIQIFLPTTSWRACPSCISYSQYR